MADRSVNELDQVWEQMREVVRQRDIKVITVTAPRNRKPMPQIDQSIIICDYVSMLSNPK